MNGKPKTDFEKLKRRKLYEANQRELMRRKRRLKKVISTKAKRRKKKAQVSACPECGEFHHKSDVCRVRELKVKMIVQQIMKHSENIKVGGFNINNKVKTIIILVLMKMRLKLVFTSFLFL